MENVSCPYKGVNTNGRRDSDDLVYLIRGLDKGSPDNAAHPEYSIVRLFNELCLILFPSIDILMHTKFNRV